jgi:transposase
MPKKQYQVSLTEAERSYLHEVIEKGERSAREIRRAHSLLLADEKRQDQEIAAFLHVNPNTISATRRRYCEVGLPAALKEKSRPGNPRKLDGKQEAFLVALACSEAPEGRDHWTMQLLADKLIELKVVEGTLSEDTVARSLKKRTSNPG